MAPRYCKKCKLVFDAETCPGAHANFMFTKTIPEGAAVAEPAAAPADEVAGDKPTSPIVRQKSAGKLAAPAGLGAMLGGGPQNAGGGPPAGSGGPPPGGGKLKAPVGLGAMIGGGGPPPGGGGLKAPAGLGAMIGGGGPPPGGGGNKLAAPMGLGAMIGGGRPSPHPNSSPTLDSGDTEAPGKPGSTCIYDEPATPVARTDNSAAKMRVRRTSTHASTPRHRPGSRRRHASLGTPPAMDPPVPPLEPEPESEPNGSGIRRTTTTARKRTDGERMPIASTLEEEDDAEGSDATPAPVE